RHDEVKRFRPRFNPDVNNWWMCDEGRFAFEGANPTDRLAGAVEFGATPGALTPLNERSALETVRDLVRLHSPAAICLSPFATQEEAKLVLDLAKAIDAEVFFASPAPNELKDDLLHTGDPCPNRKGLEQLGIEAVDAADVASKLEGKKAALFIGERIGALVGEEQMAGLPRDLRSVVFDVKASKAPGVVCSIGIANYIEKSGTFVNIDGHEGKILPARSAPAGTSYLTTSLERLMALLSQDLETSAN
ncbi:MAG: hypothetical protein AAF368_09790, partial [Planctomycetota bacterium]